MLARGSTKTSVSRIRIR